MRRDNESPLGGKAAILKIAIPVETFPEFVTSSYPIYVRY
jgi:hypothetical protein